jgi:hypothetical protein
MRAFLPELEFTKSLKNITAEGVVIEIGEGAVKKRGKKLPGLNLADYMQSNGRFDLLSFFGDPQTALSVLKYSHSTRGIPQSC